MWLSIASPTRLEGLQRFRMDNDRTTIVGSLPPQGYGVKSDGTIIVVDSGTDRHYLYTLRPRLYIRLDADLGRLRKLTWQVARDLELLDVVSPDNNIPQRKNSLCSFVTAWQQRDREHDYGYTKPMKMFTGGCTWGI